MNTVTIYSTPSCHFCHMAKDYFTEHNIPFVDFNVAEDQAKRAEMVQKSGQLGVPVIQIENNILIGFQKAKIAELLGIAQ